MFYLGIINLAILNFVRYYIYFDQAGHKPSGTGRITSEQIVKLEEVGFEFTGLFRAQWEVMFQRLQL